MPNAKELCRNSPLLPQLCFSQTQQKSYFNFDGQNGDGKQVSPTQYLHHEVIHVIVIPVYF